MIAADVVEVHVDALRRGFAQLVDHRARPVVEGRVETELVEQVADLVVGPGAADHAMAAELGDLGGQTAHCSSGGGDPDDVTVPELCRVDQPGIGGHAHRAERPEIRLCRRHRRVDPRQRGDPRKRRLTRRHDRVVAPPLGVPHGVAGRKAFRP